MPYYSAVQYAYMVKKHTIWEMKPQLGCKRLGDFACKIAFQVLSYSVVIQFGKNSRSNSYHPEQGFDWALADLSIYFSTTNSHGARLVVQTFTV